MDSGFVRARLILKLEHHFCFFSSNVEYNLLRMHMIEIGLFRQTTQVEWGP